MRQVAVLFARADSIYKTLPGTDVWDLPRDARRWRGGNPVIAHPDCRGWGRLAQFSHATEEDRQQGVLAVWLVRMHGGVLEQPAESKLWTYLGLPRPGSTPDAYGGYTIEIRQCDYGHPAEKLTWLYVVGCPPDQLPARPAARQPTHVVKPQRGVPRTLPICTKYWREATPPPLAEWLLELARRTKTPKGDQPRFERGREGMEPEACESAAGRGADGAPALATLPHYSSPVGGPMGAWQPAAAGPAEGLGG